MFNKNKELETLTLILENGEEIILPSALITKLYIKDVSFNTYKLSEGNSVHSDLCTDSFLIQLENELPESTSSFYIPDDKLSQNDYVIKRLFTNRLENKLGLCDIIGLILTYENDEPLDVTVDWRGVQSEEFHERQRTKVDDNQRSIYQDNNPNVKGWQI